MGTQGRSLVLLGAGASSEAGIPTSFEMTKVLVDRIAQGWPERHASALHYVCGSLIAYDAASGGSPFGSLDVERVFAAVELLAERRTLEVTPFVAAWHPAVDAWDEPERSAPGFFDKELADALLGNTMFNRARDLVTRLIVSVAGRAGTGETYAALAQRMVKELRSIVAVTSKDVAYLSPLVRHGEVDHGLTIATLNYDVAVEGAAELASVPLTTGIESWTDTGRWSWPDGRGVRLIKLHGSIDWLWESTRAGPGELPRRTVAVSAPTAEEGRDPVLVFGQRGKLRADGPFLGLLAEFEAHLATSSRLIVIGYSFRDDHVNEVIWRWAAEDAARTILVVDPGWPEHSVASEDFRTALTSHLVPPTWQEPVPFAPRLAVRKELCSAAVQALGAPGDIHKELGTAGSR